MNRDALVGRDADVRALREFVDRCAVDTGVLVLSGEPGVGKTALLDAAAEHARAQGMRSVAVSGSEFETGIAFAGLHQVVSLLRGREVTGPLAVALGMARGPRPGREQVVDAVHDLLVEAGAEQPLLVTVDDLHWLDRVTAMVVDEVLRRGALHRVGFLFATRGQAGGGEVRVVLPVSDEAAEELVGSRFPALTPSVRQRLVGAARGNPLALLELPAALTPAQRVGTSAVPEALPLTERLRGAFAARVSALPASTRRALLVAALGGIEEDDLAPAERAGLVDRDDGAVVFRHPLTRSAVVALSTTAERRRAHARLAERTRDRPDRFAWHLAHATAEPDEHVAALVEESAGRSRARGDTAGAVVALLRAADLSTSGADRRRRLAEAAYLGALADGRLRRVPELLDDVRGGDDAAPDLSSAVTAAHYLLFSGEGDVDTAHRLLVGAVEAQEPDTANSTVVDAVITLGWVCYFGGGPRLWDAFHRITAVLGPELPRQVSLLRALCADPVRTALSTVDSLDAEIAELDDHAPVDLVRTAFAGAFVDRVTACREPLSRLLGRAELPGTVELHVLSLLALDRLARGEWDEAVEFADDHVRLADEHGYGLLGCLGLYPRAMVAAGRGDDRTTTGTTNRVIGWAAPRGVTLLSHLAAQALSLAAVGRGDYESAYRHAATVSQPGELASHVPAAPLLVLDLVESALRTGRRDHAVAHVAAARDARLDRLSPRYVLHVGAAEAMIAPDERAFELFDTALGSPGVELWPFEHARVLLLHGERLRRARLNRRARVRLEEARAIFAGLGATPWLARTERELRPTGGHESRSLLTAQQFAVVRLAAEGLTTKEIGQRLTLSPRTVGTHLHQAFPKLGVTSRAGLRDALRSLPDAEGRP
ncbi:AAA family ATPase [Umezawaea sp. NPDC059074]|uniref:AAA family ATPase n=1 Tax=Umezawaea sp. NPDC059074 TaxID=3346716 RepID=UPI0036ABBF9E